VWSVFSPAGVVSRCGLGEKGAGASRPEPDSASGQDHERTHDETVSQR
jgi:hypothetical protein